MERVFRIGPIIACLGVLASPLTAGAACVESQQTVPIGATSGVPLTPFRANMARLDAPVGPPAARPQRAKGPRKASLRPAVVRPSASVKKVGVKKAGLVKKAAYARPHRKARPAKAAAAPLVAAAPLIPGGMTPFPGAASAPLAAPVPGMLLTRTICETAVPPAIPFLPPVAPPPPAEEEMIFVVRPPPPSPPPLVVTPLVPPGNPPVGPVPEPSTWAMMIVGFGVIGASLRRRRARLT